MLSMVLPTIAVVHSYRIIKYIVILLRKKEIEKKKETIKNLLLSIMAVLISVTLMCVIHSWMERLRQPTPSWIKTSFTQEEMETICNELRLTPSEKYQITSARYELGNQLRVYLHVEDEMAGTLKEYNGNARIYSREKLKEYINRNDGVVGFFKAVCGYPEEYLETQLIRLGNLNKLEEGFYQKYTNMFGEEQNCIIVYPYDESEQGYLHTYVWKEDEGYGLEVVREQGIFRTITSHELYEMFSVEEKEN